jgi:hypothetical protein
MIEKVSESLGMDSIRWAKPVAFRHGRGRPERALYQRAKRFRKRYRHLAPVVASALDVAQTVTRAIGIVGSSALPG